VNFGAGVLTAVVMLIAPGAVLGRAGGLRWPLAVAVAPVLTYGVAALAIVPFGALGIRWNAASAAAVLAGVTVVVFAYRVLLERRGLAPTPAPAQPRGPDWAALTAGAGVVLGAAAIAYVGWRGLTYWQSIPSNWDSMWHANTIRWILDTGQASPTHMGELRNVETKDTLYYPSAFHALAAVFAELTGSAPTTAYTLSSLAAAVWLFPLSAALLTWQLLIGRTTRMRTAAAAAAAAGLSGSFTSVPYVEFDTASMANMTAYGLAVPAFVLVTSACAHRDRVPLAIIAVVAVFSVHITAGVVLVTFLTGWWLLDALPRPRVRRAADIATLGSIAVVSFAILIPQFMGVIKQTEIIAGHEFITHEGGKKALFDAVGDKLDGLISRASFSLDMAAKKPMIEKINAMFKARSGKDLNDNTARELMALIVLADAINRAKSAEGPAIRDALAATNIPGALTIMPWKEVKFGEDGQNVNADPVLLQYVGGNFVTIFPEQVAVKAAKWPMN